MTLDALCTIVFVINEKKNAYVYYSIEFRFESFEAAFPPVQRCAMSRNDVERLIRYVDAFLHDRPPDFSGPFTGYDAEFSLEFVDDAATLRAHYRPDHSFSLGVEGSVSKPAGATFRDAWAAHLEDDWGSLS